MNGENKKKLKAMVLSSSLEIPHPSGKRVTVLPAKSAGEAARRSGVRLRDVYSVALRAGVMPYRYLRNTEAISAKEQLELARKTVAVAGAGGLGGQVIVSLARLGIGCLVVVDPDVFDESNLNRQVLCQEESIGLPKCREAARIVASINPAVLVIPQEVRLERANAEKVLSEADVIVDALDTVPDRFVLQEAALNMGVPLIHGGVAGFEGQITTIFPGDRGLKAIYGEEAAAVSQEADRPEAVMGVTPLTASLVGTLQAMEVLKVVLDRGKVLRNNMLYVDLEAGSFSEFELIRDDDG